MDHRLFCKSLPLLLAVHLLLWSSCATTSVVTKYDSDTFVHNANNGRTTWCYAWGLVKPNDINPKCESGYMNRVKVKTNAGFILLTVVTLGIVIPQHIEWDCAPKDIPAEQIGN